MSATEIETTQELLVKKIGHKYKDIQYFKSGAMRHLFLATIGDCKPNRIIKVDRKVNGVRPERYYKSGCTTENEANIAIGFKEPEKNHLSTLYDYDILDKDLVFSVEKYHEGYETLETFIDNFFEKERTKKEYKEHLRNIESVFSQVLEGAKYMLKDEVCYHRDLSAKNILVKKQGSLMDALITDFGNSCKKGHIKPKSLPTAGNHWISDPFMFTIFTGKEKEYEEKREIFSLGVELYHSLTGKRIIETVPDKGTLVDCLTGESLLAKDGTINKEKYEFVLNREIAKSQILQKKYGSIIKRCMASDDSKRYSSIDEFLNDFENARKPGFFERVKQKWKTAAAIAVLALSTCGGTFALNQHFNNKELEKIVKESERYEIRSEWKGLDIISNYVELDVNIYGKDYCNNYPKENILFGKAGDCLGSWIIAKNYFKNQGPILLQGKMYIEGYESKKFSAWTTGEIGEWEEGMPGAFLDLKIPKDISDGVYMIAIELYAPNDFEATDQQKKAVQNLKFNKDKVICRKRIPLVIGDIEKDKILDINKMYFYNYSQEMSVNRADKEEYVKDVNKNLVYEVLIPELNYKRTFTGTDDKYGCSNMFHTGNLDLPQGTDTKDMMLQLTIRDKDKGNKPIAYRFMPLKRILLKNCDGDSVHDYLWEFPIPGKDFSEKIIEYRKKLNDKSS